MAGMGGLDRVGQHHTSTYLAGSARPPRARLSAESRHVILKQPHAPGSQVQEPPLAHMMWVVYNNHVLTPHALGLP